jgi:hypothetical protein
MSTAEVKAGAAMKRKVSLIGSVIDVTRVM